MAPLSSIGCLTTALLTAGAFDYYTVPSMLVLLAVIPFYFTLGFAVGGPFAYKPHAFPTMQQALADFKSRRSGWCEFAPGTLTRPLATTRWVSLS